MVITSLRLYVVYILRSLNILMIISLRYELVVRYFKVIKIIKIYCAPMSRINRCFHKDCERTTQVDNENTLRIGALCVEGMLVSLRYCSAVTRAEQKKGSQENETQELRDAVSQTLNRILCYVLIGTVRIHEQINKDNVTRRPPRTTDRGGPITCIRDDYSWD